jgi:hypothetical protein
LHAVSKASYEATNDEQDVGGDVKILSLSLNRVVMKNLLLPLLVVCLSHTVFGQVYVEKQSRHRFAQMTIGLDYQTLLGGSTQYLDASGSLSALDVPMTHKARFIIGGTHFWGHADFHVAIPLFNPTIAGSGQRFFSTSGVETVFKFYPWRIENRKLRFFTGVALAPFRYQQDNNNLPFAEGGRLTYTRVPVLTGLTYNHGPHLIDLTFGDNLFSEIDYYISRETQVAINPARFSLSVAYRYMFETSVSAEEDWESGRTAEVTRILAERGELDGLFVGAGLSSAWWLGNSSYNETNRPYMPGFGITTLYDFAVGYYWHRPDLDVALIYRGYSGEGTAYDTRQTAQRRSVGLEVKKYLWDYQGFVPFAGPVVTSEWLNFEEVVDGQVTTTGSRQQLGYGLTVGWDIRPSRLQGVLLRTNLRYFPNLNLGVGEGQSIRFDTIEFNFIQIVVYPSRVF